MQRQPPRRERSRDRTLKIPPRRRTRNHPRRKCLDFGGAAADGGFAVVVALATCLKGSECWRTRRTRSTCCYRVGFDGGCGAVGIVGGGGMLYFAPGESKMIRLE